MQLIRMSNQLRTSFYTLGGDNNHCIITLLISKQSLTYLGSFTAKTKSNVVPIREDLTFSCGQ